MNTDSELRQYLLEHEEVSRTRQTLAWARLRDRLYGQESPHHWSDGLWRNIAVGAVAAFAVFAIGSQWLGTPKVAPDNYRASGIVRVNLPARTTSSPSNVVFVTEEAPEVSATSFYSQEAQADVIWVSNAGYVKE